MTPEGFNFGPSDLSRLAGAGNVLPLSLEMGADLLTPVGAFLRLARGARCPFLLESIEGGESLARYSFLGRDPTALVRTMPGEESLPEGGGPLGPLRRAIAPFRSVRLPDLPRFTGGAVGFVSFDLVRRIERIGGRQRDDLNSPDLLFGLYDTIVAFDHLKQRIQIISNIHTEREGGALGRRGLGESYRAARRRIETILALLRRPLPAARRTRVRPGRWRTLTSARRFQENVRRVQSYIRRGDVFQVVLSQRFDRQTPAAPFAVYRALRRINPSPYMYYLDFGEVALAGSSPEMLVRVEGSRIRTRPIAGTRPRGRDEREDARLEQELLADAKERAEHVMLVDLGRNDVGKVSRAGSVAVTRFLSVERYSHVMHLVSQVDGQLRPGQDAFDGLLSCFPAGTVSGAPKVRAMEIIDELETTRRGPYAGAVCYADYSGHLDSCITIRTVVMRGGMAHVQAGAGVVADSAPEREHRECVNKASALIEAVERAEAAT